MEVTALDDVREREQSVGRGVLDVGGGEDEGMWKALPVVGMPYRFLWLFLADKSYKPAQTIRRATWPGMPELIPGSCGGALDDESDGDELCRGGTKRTSLLTAS